MHESKVWVDHRTLTLSTFQPGFLTIAVTRASRGYSNSRQSESHRVGRPVSCRSANMNRGYVIALRFVNPLFCIISTFSTHYMYEECVPFRNVQHEYPNPAEVSFDKKSLSCMDIQHRLNVSNCTMVYTHFKISTTRRIILSYLIVIINTKYKKLNASDALWVIFWNKHFD